MKTYQNCLSFFVIEILESLEQALFLETFESSSNSWSIFTFLIFFISSLFSFIFLICVTASFCLNSSVHFLAYQNLEVIFCFFSQYLKENTDIQSMSLHQVKWNYKILMPKTIFNLAFIKTSFFKYRHLQKRLKSKLGYYNLFILFVYY